jgi:hypothetical protein
MPIMGQVSSLEHLKGWILLYHAGLSNLVRRCNLPRFEQQTSRLTTDLASHMHACMHACMQDVWLLSFVKLTVLLALVLAAPTTCKKTKEGGSGRGVFARLRLGSRITCASVKLLLLAKASLVAVVSPDDVWPVVAPQQGQPVFVGLFYM